MAKVKVAQRKPSTIAYIEHRGPYKDIPWDDTIERLYAFAKRQRLRPGFRPMALYPDDPARTDPGAVRTQVALPVRGPAAAEGEVHVAQLPGSPVATRKFEGTAADYAAAYGEIRSWIDANGYEPAGAPGEVYTKMPKRVDGKLRIFSRLEVPVRRR